MPPFTKAYLANPTFRTVQVSLPELGEDYFLVHELGAKELEQLDELFKEDRSQWVYEILWRVLVDEQGNHLFTDAADVKAGLNLSFVVLHKLFDKVVEVLGLHSKN